jgi:hypothetical protein
MTVRELITEHRAAFSLLPMVLIASIDSERRVAAMPWAQAKISQDNSWALSTVPLVIAGRSLARLTDTWASLSSGFDEIWVPTDFPVTVPPESAYLVAPRRLDTSLPSEIEDWMPLCRCALGLGDGEGLNFVTSDAELAANLGIPVLG